MSIKPKINRDLNSVKVNFGSKLGNLISDRVVNDGKDKLKIWQFFTFS